MKNTISFINKEIALAAFEEAKTQGFSSSFDEKSLELTVACVSDAAMSPVSNEVMSYIDNQLRWMREDMNYSMKRLEEHMKGHLPAIQDVGKMNEVLKKLGLDDSFYVEKKRVSVEY